MNYGYKFSTNGGKLKRIVKFATVNTIRMQKTLSVEYQQFSSIEDLQSEDARLVRAAIEATNSSYSPYSHFQVGAAVLLENGEIVTGANQENAAYPSGLCAERTAMFSAGAQFHSVAQRAIAIAAKQNGALTSTPASPCGACRQVMAEYQKLAGKPMKVILYGKDVIYIFSKVDDILPLIFNNI